MRLPVMRKPGVKEILCMRNPRAGLRKRLSKREQLLKSQGMSASAKSVRFGRIPLTAGLSLGQGIAS
jgi:hypothetical protein